MINWSQVLDDIRTRLGNCTATELAHVLEVSIPTMTSWIKGVDPKANHVVPTYCYAAILLRATELPIAQLEFAFKEAVKMPTMGDMKLKVMNGKRITANRSLEYEELLNKQPSALQTFLKYIYLDGVPNAITSNSVNQHGQETSQEQSSGIKFDS